VNIYLKPAGVKRTFVNQPIRLGESNDFSVDFRIRGTPLLIEDRMKKTLEIRRDLIEDYLRQRYVGGPFGEVDIWVAFRAAGWPSQNFYLRTRLDAPPLPAIPNWYRGDVHYHSGFTDNPAERGYPLSVTKQAALQASLDWLLLTDHSTDLSAEKYAEMQREISSYRDGRIVMIRGEEVTAASAQSTLLTTLHLIALPSPEDPDRGFPGVTQASQGNFLSTGDGSPSSPAIPLREALARITSSGGFAFAAHPFDPISPIVRGGVWDLALDFLAPTGDRLQPGLVGLEAWNRATTATADDARDPFCLRQGADPSGCFHADEDANEYTRLEKGIDLGWRPLLIKGLQPRAEKDDSPPFKVFLAAGSDAHGDFNYEATMDVVDFLAKPARAVSGYAENNALGKILTMAYCPDGMGRRGENVLRALREGQSILSNGPMLIAGFDRNGNGSLDDPEDVGIGHTITSSLSSLPPLQIHWISSPEFGTMESIRLVVGSSKGESPPEEIPLPALKVLASDGLFPVDLRPWLGKIAGSWSYIRLEARTRNRAGEEFRCYTNPIWVRLTQQ
jgi:hypothetical protein